jgi:hypothetical protein
MKYSGRRGGRRFALSFISLFSVLGSGCVTTPEFDKLSGITPATIVEVVKCELIWAAEDHPQLVGSPPWVAVADLTLQVDETTTLTPSFSHTDVVSRTFSRVFNWGVKLDTQAQRIYTQSVTFRIRSLKDPAGRCANRESIGGAGFALNGRLGLSEIVGMAFGSTKYVPGKSGAAGNFEPRDKYLALLAAAASGPRNEAKSKYFGQALEFVVTKNINSVGPTWVLTFFRGPGGFMKIERGDTNKLAISFAPDTRGEENAESAAAYSNSTLLQQNSASRLNQIQQMLNVP